MKKELIEKYLNDEAFDNAVERAKLTRLFVRTIYNFVKMNRPEGEGLDERDGPERESLADVVDVVERHYFNMLKDRRKTINQLKNKIIHINQRIYIINKKSSRINKQT